MRSDTAARVTDAVAAVQAHAALELLRANFRLDFADAARQSGSLGRAAVTRRGRVQQRARSTGLLQ